MSACSSSAIGSSVAGFKTVNAMDETLVGARAAEPPDPVDDPGEDRRDEQREDPERLPGTRERGRRLPEHVHDEGDGQREVDEEEREVHGTSRVDEAEREPTSGEAPAPYTVRDARNARACSTSASKSAASSPASGCHCTPTANRSDGSSTASSVPSSAHAVSIRPSPSRPRPWWWCDVTSEPAPTIAARRDPSFTSTGCTANSPGTLLWTSFPTASGRCCTRSPPRATFR